MITRNSAWFNQSGFYQISLVDDNQMIFLSVRITL